MGSQGRIVCLVSVVAVVAAVVVGLVLPRLVVLCGYSAKIACSAVFVQQRPLSSVVGNELGGFPWSLATVELNDARQTVTAYNWVLGTTRTAAHVNGFGCVLLSTVDADTVRAARRAPLDGDTPRSFVEQDVPRDDPWPLGDAPVRDGVLGDHGVDAAVLTEAMKLAWDEEDPTKPKQSRGVVVAHKGELVYERYADGYTAQSRFAGWSMTKSLTSALIGVRVGQGAASLDDAGSAVAPEWPSPDDATNGADTRSSITVRSLLQMSSGLAFAEVYSKFTVTDVAAMLFQQNNAAAFAATSKHDHPIDTRWAYSSGTTNILSRYLRNTFSEAGGDAAYWRFPYQHLFSKVGMYSMILETDETGTFVGSSFAHATARDWTRFGQLYMQDGVWDGERILPEGWVEFSTTPAAASLKGPRIPKPHSYGAQLWLNQPMEAGAKNATIVKPKQSWPADAYFAHGYERQIVLVVPSRDLVITRLGFTKRESWWEEEAWAAAVINCFPESASQQ